MEEERTHYYSPKAVDRQLGWRMGTGRRRKKRVTLGSREGRYDQSMITHVWKCHGESHYIQLICSSAYNGIFATF
jgi:hypothetical protein